MSDSPELIQPFKHSAVHCDSCWVVSSSSSGLAHAYLRHKKPHCGFCGGLYVNEDVAQTLDATTLTGSILGMEE